MLRKFLDWQLSLTKTGKLHWFHPVVAALDTFLYEPAQRTKTAPHIRDAVDLKRWMSIVILALVPCIFMTVWNTGLQKMVYASGNWRLMDEYLLSSTSFNSYLTFATKDLRWLTILWEGSKAFVPVMLISYMVGGFWEILFAAIRKHDIAEGFLVTGMLYALILPPTIPYWMVAVGVSAGVVLGKELFGGTGMNIFNPALVCRCFLFFTFPGKMTGDVWVGTNPTVISESLNKMNYETAKVGIDAYSQATPLKALNIVADIKRIHVDAIASSSFGENVSTIDTIRNQLHHWTASHSIDAVQPLGAEQLQQFVTSPLMEGGLGLAPQHYEPAYQFAKLQYGIGTQTDGNFFFGNHLGSMGETSAFACLLGALILIYTGVGSWRLMLSTLLGAFVCSSLFEFGARYFGVDSGAWNAAKYIFPAYKHLILGGLAFAAVFMSTDPVSAPGNKLARWIYGLFIGMVTIIIRVINPAYPEGVMLAILLGNTFAPLIDRTVIKYSRRAYHVSTR